MRKEMTSFFFFYTPQVEKRQKTSALNNNSVLFIRLVGPPQVLFKPEDYFKIWLGKDRQAATDTNNKAWNLQADESLKYIYIIASVNQGQYIRSINKNAVPLP